MKSYIFTGNALTLVIDCVPYTVDNDHPRFNEILAAVKAGEWDDIPSMISVAKAIEAFGTEHGVVVDEDEGVIRYNGEVLHNSLTNRIIWMMRDGFDVNPFVNFVQKLMKNPSKRAIDELYTFLEYGKLPITEDGCFLAYKRVRGDYLDVASGTCLNKPATLLTEAELANMPHIGGRLKEVKIELVDGVTTLSMPRNKVQDNSQITCSDGLHFCSLEYLKSFSGERIVIMKIDPADVVSIPADYNNTKGRCCKYQVVGEYEGSMTDPAFTKSVVSSDGTDYTSETNEMSDDEDVNYISGYVEGYSNGRSKEASQYDETDLLAAECHNDYDAANYIEGYLLGYKDGRGHKARRYTLE